MTSRAVVPNRRSLVRAPLPGRAWVRAGLAMAAIGWGANQFSPLIVLYQRHGVSASATQLMFGLYAVGLVPALLIGGRWSDEAGRHRVVCTALLTSITASAALMLGTVTPWCLYPGRLLTGISSGLAFGTGAAWIRELSAADGRGTAGPRRATIAMTIGFGGGPLIAGAVAQWAPLPETLAYLPHLVVAASALVALRGVSSDIPTTSRQGGVENDRPPRPIARHMVMVLMPFAPWVFGTAAVALAYLPSLAADAAGGASLLFAAITTAIPAFAGIAVQPLVTRAFPALPTSPLLAAMATAIAGFAVAAWAAHAPGLVPMLIASVVLGAAYGVTLLAGLADVQQVADPARLGTATATYQAICYVGFAFPYALTIAEKQFGWQPAQGLLVLLAGAVVATIWLSFVTTNRRRATRQQTA